jgi:hypothetical protein
VQGATEISEEISVSNQEVETLRLKAYEAGIDVHCYKTGSTP